MNYLLCGHTTITAPKLFSQQEETMLVEVASQVIPENDAVVASQVI
jgi:hypothetical protein